MSVSVIDEFNLNTDHLGPEIIDLQTRNKETLVQKGLCGKIANKEKEIHGHKVNYSR